MKTRLLSSLLLLLLALPAWAQVLSTSGGYQLTSNDIEPALKLLTFLVQEDLSEYERNRVIQESVDEFQSDPSGTLQRLRELASSVQLVHSKNDPLVLGEFRQRMLSEFYRMTQSTPENEMPAFLSILNRRAPVVAYDPNTDVALTEKDLIACLNYMQKMNALQGENVSNQDLLLAGQEVIDSFTQIDPETQKMLASGTLLISLYQGNMNRMSSQQQNEVKSHYRTTVGGPPTGTTRGPEQPEIVKTLAQSGLRNHEGMMESLRESGGTTNYWDVVEK